MKKRITITDIAHEAGVSHSTVSRALKNDPRISPSIRKKIHTIAQDMGYRPDPRVSELMAHLRTGRTTSEQTTLAWINHKCEEDIWHKQAWAHEFLNGARTRAAHHGYKLEEFWLGDATRSGTSLVERILRARNINGLLLAPLFDLNRPWSLDWSRYSSVSIGTFPHQSGMDFVDSDDYHNTLTCLQALQSMGHRRIGFVNFSAHLPRPGNPLLAAYLESKEVFEMADIPPFLHTPPAAGRPLENFRIWFTRHKPTVILSESDWIAGELQRIKVKIPRECGIALLDARHATLKNASGMVLDFEVLSAAAVDVLHARLITHRLGLPPTATATLIRGTWHNGDSVLPINSQQIP